MVTLAALVAQLDDVFHLAESEPDPAFSRYLPAVYEETLPDWRMHLEPRFSQRYNGLMLRGAGTVHTAWCSVFPSPQVLDVFLRDAAEGDLLFLHHPLDIECGDPQGPLGRGFRPIAGAHLDALRARGLSVYTMHTPMDLHPDLGTTAAMVHAIGGRSERGFWASGGGHAGVVCAVEPTTTRDVMTAARALFEVPYLDFAGRMHNRVDRIAVVAGAGYKVPPMKEAEALGAQVYLAGEIFDRIDDDFGRRLFRDVQDFATGTAMSLIGVSHASSEYLVMKTRMVAWLTEHGRVDARLIPPPQWWR